MTQSLAKRQPELPRVSDATLPATYERARVALETCQRVDECKDWADKAAALASYARQADDDSLHKFAVRIQARAVRRCGELLKTFQSPGGRPKTGATHAVVSQRGAAEAAGMNEHQEKQAVRVANVPSEDFDAAVDSDNPPTITALAERGTEKQPPAPAGFADATKVIGILKGLSVFCADHSAAAVARGVYDHEVATVCQNLDRVHKWLRDFRAELENGECLRH